MLFRSDYDPLLAKLAAWGATRDSAITKLDRALREYAITGIRTNTAWFRDVLSDEEFREGRLSTAFLDAFPSRRRISTDDPEREAAELLVQALQSKSNGATVVSSSVSNWARLGREESMR